MKALSLLSTDCTSVNHSWGANVFLNLSATLGHCENFFCISLNSYIQVTFLLTQQTTVTALKLTELLDEQPTGDAVTSELLHCWLYLQVLHFVMG